MQAEFKTRSQAQLGIFDYIEAWYNNERIDPTLQGVSLREFEELKMENFIRKKIGLTTQCYAKIQVEEIRNRESNFKA